MLIIAAFGKAWDAPRIVASRGLLSNPSVLAIVIAFEVCAAATILCSSARYSRFIVIAVYTLLAIVSSVAILTGFECNCFGKNFGAWLTLPIDVAIVFSAFAVRPAAKRNVPTLGWKYFVSIGILGRLVLVSVGITRLHSVQTNDVLSAKDMVGKELFLNSKLCAELATIEHGDWIVLIVRNNCAHCVEVHSRFFQMLVARELSVRTVVFQAGRTEWPYVLDHVDRSFPNTTSMEVKWLNTESFVVAPAIFYVRNGRVVSAANGDDCDQWIVNFN